MATSDDLVVLLLANSGILGFLSFLFNLLFIKKKAYKI